MKELTDPKAVSKKPVVLFMKGTPSLPQCGFSRAVCQVLEMQGVPSEKLQTYNVLEDDQLRQDIKEYRYVLFSRINRRGMYDVRFVAIG